MREHQGSRARAVTVERRPKRGDWYRLSWNDRWKLKRNRDFRGKGARARAAESWETVQGEPLARFEGWEDGKHVHIAGWTGRIAICRDGQPARETVRQAALPLEGE